MIGPHASVKVEEIAQTVRRERKPSLADLRGRFSLLPIVWIGMAVTLGAMAWMFGTSPVNAEGFPVLSSSAGLVALLAANIYVFCFGFSWGPVVWVLLGEMFNNKIRASALSLGAGVQWVANFAVSTTFPPIACNLGFGFAYGLYAGFSALSFFFVDAFIKETKGMELENMA